MNSSNFEVWIAATTFGVACGLSFGGKQSVRRYLVPILVILSSVLALTAIPDSSSVGLSRAFWTIWGLVSVSAAAVVLWSESRAFRLSGLSVLCLCSVAPPVAMNHPTTLFGLFGIALLAFLTTAWAADSESESLKCDHRSNFQEPWIAAVAAGTLAFLLLSSLPARVSTNESRRSTRSDLPRPRESAALGVPATTRNLIVRGGMVGLILLSAVLAQTGRENENLREEESSSSMPIAGDSGLDQNSRA